MLNSRLCAALAALALLGCESETRTLQVPSEPKDTTGADAAGDEGQPPVDPGTTPDDGPPADEGARDDGAGEDAGQDVACAHECEPAGATRCYDQGPGKVQICETDRDGCRLWGPPSSCPAGACEQGACVVGCQSDPACAAAGDHLCANVGTVRLCAEVEPGCLKLGAPQACPTGMTCDAAAGCQCIAGCPMEGQAECFDETQLRVCDQTPEGCLVWSLPVACPEGGTCAAGVCEAPCVSDSGCDSVGLTTCYAPDALTTCEEVEPGCLRWGEPTPCGGTQTCSAGACEATCTSDCPEAGAATCGPGGGEQTCEEVEPGCLKWSAPSPCNPNQTCVPDAGCTCNDQCEAGAASCETTAELVKFCNSDDEGCLFWNYAYCGAEEVCQGGACISSCVPDPDCTTAGLTRCLGAGTEQVCEEAEPGCLKWGAITSCPPHQVCSTDSCACKVVEGCDADGAKSCDGATHVKTCAEDEAGCFFFLAAVACPDGQTCSAGACVDGCVSDPGCGAAGDARCKGGLEEVCTEVEPGCLKWGMPAACPANQVCAAGEGCACNDACSSEGATSCDPGGFVLTCVADAGGCLYEEASSCEGGAICVDGACGQLTSPLVDCGAITFLVADAGYATVHVGGTFNDWDAASTPLTLEDGLWQATVVVPAAGTWEYKLVIDDLWQLDPLNPATIGSGVFTNNVVDVPLVSDCTGPGVTQCAGGGLEICGDVQGCLAWGPAPEPCTAPDTYCAIGQCATFASPVVTATEVTITVRDKGYGSVALAGSFTDPPWGVQLPMDELEGRFAITFAIADFPGLLPGAHQYKLVTDADQWFEDPVNPDKVDDTEGGFNSVLLIEGECSDTCDPAGPPSCADASTETGCGPGPDGCNHPTAASCPAGQYCLLEMCESFPIVAGGAATFVFPDDGATTMHVAGDFTEPPWESGPIAMTLQGASWVVTTGALAPGDYQYKLVRNWDTDQTWLTDPHNPNTADDGLGGQNSVFTIP